MIKRLIACLILPCILLNSSLTTAAQSAVTAEAVGTANLRTSPSTEAELIGQINNGTRYPVIGRSEFFPWLLLGRTDDAQPLGWVFADLVNVYGDISVVPLSALDLSAVESAPTSPGFTPTALSATDLLPTGTVIPDPPVPTSAEQTPSAAGVTGNVAGEINIRYGPGVDYPRVGVVQAGDVLTLTARHLTLPWVQVSFPDSPTGFGWVAAELLQINGDLMALPAVTVTDASLPTLTPTPSAIEVASVIGETPVPLSPEFATLGDQLWSMVLQSGFDPATSTMGSLFLMDVQTGEALSFGSEIAFSGMSVNKIAILADYFRQFESPLRDDQAVTLAEAMICSENISTNELLAAIGGGDPYAGAEDVSEFLQALGLDDTFIYTPYANDPFITPQAPLTRQTDADQVSAQPDPYNQMTVEQMGALLNAMYQCAYSERGLLLETFPDQFTPTECRQMLSVMNYNRIGSLLEVGVPANVPISHKHGWIDDTHGDAAVVFSPGGTYVLVVVLHSPQWLNFEISAPLISEISRTVYNFYNSDAPLDSVRVVEGLGDVESCNNSLLGSPIIIELTTREF